MREFVAMGGYGPYVWAAYGFTILVLLALFWQSWRSARKRTAELAALKEQQRAARPRPRRPLVAERPRQSEA